MKATRAALGLRQQAVFAGIVGPPAIVAGAVLTDATGLLVMLGTLAALVLLHVVFGRRAQWFNEPYVVSEGVPTASVATTLVRRLAGDVLFLAMVAWALVNARETSYAMLLGVFGIVFAARAILYVFRARALERWEHDHAMLVLEPGGLFSTAGLCAVPLASGR